MSNFNDLNLAEPILKTIIEQGYEKATPVQMQTIPALIDGNDVLGVAQTGTGKTAAFSLPLLHRLSLVNVKAKSKKPRALILAPTRELAMQIGNSIKIYGKHLHLRTAIVFGGSPIRPQIQNLNKGVHILVATPGRLLDLKRQGHVELDNVEVFVLDEADRMLDMGFIDDIKLISAAMPKERQTVLFSATMPRSLKGLVDSLLNNPVRVEVEQAATTAKNIEQKVLFVQKDKKMTLLNELLAQEDKKRVLVFTRTKANADKVIKNLIQNDVRAAVIHGDKQQRVRERALKNFAFGKIRVLVATDVAARGIDVDNITHVINYELPNEPDSYVHRIGRTGRAGASGIAISFCDLEERNYLRSIERVIKQDIEVDESHEYHCEKTANAKGGSSKGRKFSRKSKNSSFRGKKKGNGGGRKWTSNSSGNNPSGTNSSKNKPVANKSRVFKCRKKRARDKAA